MRQKFGWMIILLVKSRPESIDLGALWYGFSEEVWKVLVQIPYGETMTYGEIAEKINCGSAQAVGGAVGKNPLSIIVPCHRVLGNQGQLTGYAGGVERKCWLLEHEKANF